MVAVDDPRLPWKRGRWSGQSDRAGAAIYLRDRMLGDVSPLTCRSYAFDLLRWFRLLWTVDVGWEQATEAEAAALVGWLRTAPNHSGASGRTEAAR